MIIGMYICVACVLACAALIVFLVRRLILLQQTIDAMDDYIGDEFYRSDFRSAGDMRRELERLQKLVDEANFKPSELCAKHHVQFCSVCDNLSCGDNSVEENKHA